MNNIDNRNKAELIKKALTIVDELAELEYDDYEEFGELVERAEKLKKNRLFVLKQKLNHKIIVFILNGYYEKKKKLLD